MKTPNFPKGIKSFDIERAAKLAVNKEPEDGGEFSAKREMSRYNDLFVMHGWASTFRNAAKSVDNECFFQMNADNKILRDPFGTYRETFKSAFTTACWNVRFAASKEIEGLVRFFGRFCLVNAIAELMKKLDEESQNPASGLPRFLFKCVSFRQDGEIMKGKLPHEFKFQFDVGAIHYHYLLSEDWKTIRPHDSEESFPVADLPKKLDELMKTGAEEVIDLANI